MIRVNPGLALCIVAVNFAVNEGTNDLKSVIEEARSYKWNTLMENNLFYFLSWVFGIGLCFTFIKEIVPNGPEDWVYNNSFKSLAEINKTKLQKV